MLELSIQSVEQLDFHLCFSLCICKLGITLSVFVPEKISAISILIAFQMGQILHGIQQDPWHSFETGSGLEDFILFIYLRTEQKQF